MTVILGIDPGSRITGYGIVQQQQGKLHYVASGCIRMTSAILSVKLRQIYDDVSQLMGEYSPDEVGIESVFMHRNVQAAIKLGQARGAAIVAAAAHATPVSEYSARQIKQAVVGYGAATKEQVQHMICQILKLNASPQADAADALAVAICHSNTTLGLNRLIGVKRISHGRFK